MPFNIKVKFPERKKIVKKVTVGDREAIETIVKLENIVTKTSQLENDSDYTTNAILNTAINNEKTARQNADTTLQQNIKPEGIHGHMKPRFTFWIYKLMGRLQFSLTWRF